MMDEAQEYFISFNTVVDPGKVQAVRVRIDLVTIADMQQEFRINLCDHPLYPELRTYVLDNLGNPAPPSR